MLNITVNQLMDQSGVRFGTSGARGLVSQLTDQVGYVYTQGFLKYLESTGELHRRGEGVAIGGDLRPSTDRIVQAVARAVADLGYRPIQCGRIPSPAVALYGLTQGLPSIMVTGSHIPADRNGIKFNKCSGEVLKSDEAGIQSQAVGVPPKLFTRSGHFTEMLSGPVDPCPEALQAYRERYLTCLAPDALAGLRLGVYQHSAVGRDLLVDLLTQVGADVTPLSRSDTFIPVDTEAIREEDVDLARRWSSEHQFDAIVSTDGDSDRPLISDERGEWVRGDLAGILCAKYLRADSISTPVSCNTAVEKCGWFTEVRRTRIGSPYVVASMIDASAHGAKGVVGYEANGGFLTNSKFAFGRAHLSPLPTRDALVLLLSLLLSVQQEGRKLSQLIGDLPPRFTVSDRLEDFAQERSQAIMNRFETGDEGHDRTALEAVLGPVCGKVVAVNRTDGIRVSFDRGDIVHLRPSGNAPEFRCYTEADTEDRARETNRLCLRRLLNA